jgi:superoxide dismutase, Cu-Zn family
MRSHKMAVAWGVLRGLSRAAALSALVGCTATNTTDWNMSNLFPKTGASAVAVLMQRNGSVVTGTISFVQKGGKVAVVGVVQNLNPGPHSIYIHEKGNCNSPNAASAGKVWTLIGAPQGRARVGDLPELLANSEGSANIVTEVRGITIADGSPLDIVGRSVVVHSGLDPDPRPEFGVRNGWLACGVIQAQ